MPAYDMTPDEYHAKWRLKPHYPTAQLPKAAGAGEADRSRTQTSSAPESQAAALPHPFGGVGAATEVQLPMAIPSEPPNFEASASFIVTCFFAWAAAR